MNLGFIGLGAMGRHMASNLMKHGHTLGVYSRRAESAAPLVAAGATPYDTPAALATHSEVVFTMVTSSRDVEEVVCGADGLARGARPGTVVVEMETVSPTMARHFAAELAKVGVDMLDAPVSGGVSGAEQATLTILVGGKPEVFARIKPLFACLGTTIVHLGDIGAGQVTKACNQLLIGVTAQGVAEALILAKRSGLDPALVREVLLGTVAASRVLSVFGKRMIEREFGAFATTTLLKKDFEIVLGLARELGVAAPASAATLQMIDAAVARGDGSSDIAILIDLLDVSNPTPID